jgi:hypothetical protein
VRGDDGMIVGRRTRVGVRVGLLDGLQVEGAWVKVEVGVAVGVAVITGISDKEMLLEGCELRALLVGLEVRNVCDGTGDGAGLGSDWGSPEDKIEGLSLSLGTKVGDCLIGIPVGLSEAALPLSGGFDTIEVGARVGDEDGSGCGISVVEKGNGALDTGYCVGEGEGRLLGKSVGADSGG